MIRTLIILILILYSSACQPRPTAVPIAENKLAEVIIDVLLAEAAIDKVGLEAKDSLLHLYYDQICTIHGISRDALDSTLHMLRYEPTLMETVYGDVLDEVSRRQALGSDEEQK